MSKPSNKLTHKSWEDLHDYVEGEIDLLNAQIETYSYEIAGEHKIENIRAQEKDICMFEEQIAGHKIDLKKSMLKLLNLLTNVWS